MAAFAFLAAIVLLPSLLGFIADALLWGFNQFMAMFRGAE